MNGISPVGPGLLPSIQSLGQQSAGNESLFLDLLRSAVNEHHAAQDAIGASYAGDVTDVETLMAMRRAQMSLQLLVRVRDQLVDAFNELRQIQL